MVRERGEGGMVLVLPIPPLYSLHHVHHPLYKGNSLLLATPLFFRFVFLLDYLQCMPGPKQNTTYSRRGRRSRYRSGKTADYIRRRTSAGHQANQLLRLNKQVSALTIANRQRTLWQQFYMENQFPQDPDNFTPLVLPYKFVTVPLVRPDKWRPCFQSIGSQDSGGAASFGPKYMGQSMDLQLRFAVTDNAASLPQTIVHMWIVKMTNETGNQVL